MPEGLPRGSGFTPREAIPCGHSGLQSRSNSIASSASRRVRLYLAAIAWVRVAGAKGDVAPWKVIPMDGQCHLLAGLGSSVHLCQSSNTGKNEVVAGKEMLFSRENAVLRWPSLFFGFCSHSWCPRRHTFARFTFAALISHSHEANAFLDVLEAGPVRPAIRFADSYAGSRTVDDLYEKEWHSHGKARKPCQKHLEVMLLRLMTPFAANNGEDTRKRPAVPCIDHAVSPGIFRL